MKVLIVAPKICSPWTEGRKKFVLDLIQASQGRWNLGGLVTLDKGETTELPDGFSVRTAENRKDHLLILVRELEQAIVEHQPDLVCHFPFGAFSGLRGLANVWAIRRIARICRRRQVPCCTSMYSLTAEADNLLIRSLLPKVYFNQYAGNDSGIRFGVRLPAAILPPQVHRHANTLLFMSGAAEASAERLEYVLDVRGLRLLLQAGQKLGTLGYRLRIAIPFLDSQSMLDRIRQHPDNSWDPDKLEFRARVSIPEAFQDAGAFVFPYGQEEKQFVPTSIVEAMHFGIPVVLPRLQFLAQFYQDTPIGLIYTPADAASLVEQISRLHTDADTVWQLRDQAAAFVGREYDIANTVKDLEAVYANLAAANSDR